MARDLLLHFGMNKTHLILSLLLPLIWFATAPATVHALEFDLQLDQSISPTVSVGVPLGERVTAYVGLSASYMRGEDQGLGRTRAGVLSVPVALQFTLTPAPETGFVPTLRVYAGYYYGYFGQTFPNDMTVSTTSSRSSGVSAGLLLGGRYLFNPSLGLDFGIGPTATWVRSRNAGQRSWSQRYDLSYRVGLVIRI